MEGSRWQLEQQQRKHCHNFLLGFVKLSDYCYKTTETLKQAANEGIGWGCRFEQIRWQHKQKRQTKFQLLNSHKLRCVSVESKTDDSVNIGLSKKSNLNLKMGRRPCKTIVCH